MENNNSMSRVERSRREKVTRYSVRKVSFGAASVAVAAFFMFLGNGAVYAAEPNVTATDSALAATPANNQLDENSGSSEATAPKAQADTTTPAPTDASSTSVESSTVSKAQADATTSKPADATPAPVVSSTTSTTEETPEKATPALDKKQLEDYVAEIDAKLASDSYATKTDESVATLKEHLGLAKLALTTAKSQDELTKAYRRLFMTVNSGLRSKPKAQVESPKLDTTEGKATVGKKASNTEKATGTNSIANSGKHDPRNGQALDANNPFRTGDAATTDEGNDSSINATNLDVVNPYFEDNRTTPTKEEKWKVIDKIDFVGWQLVNSKQTKVVVVNGKATSYGGHSGVVNQTHPNSIPLALYTTKNDPNSKSDQFGGIYQDINVKPGQEVVIGFNSTNFGGFATPNNKVKVIVSYPDKGDKQQGTVTWRTFVNPYSGVFTVPDGVTKVRIRLEAADGAVSQDDKGKINIDGKDYYLGQMVSNLTISTGAHVVTTTPKVKYEEQSPSATATTVQATISLDVENQGHFSSGNNKYIVKLPENAKYVSSEGGTAATVKDGTLTINYKSLAPGERKTLTYTVELPADKASSNDFNGVNSFNTSTSYNGLIGDVVAGGATGTLGAKIRNIPVKTQNVTVNMYKTDLQNKVNELETKLAQLNESDYTKESWKAMQDQLAEAKNILSEETNNVPVADRKNQSEINTKLVLLEKEKAKLDLEKAAKDQIAAIEAVDGSVKEEKEAAKAKVIEALAAAKKAVDSAATEADVATKLTEETNKITPILPAEEVKTAAKNHIQSVLEEKKTQIAARDDLTTEEKEAAVKEAERLAQDAKNRVDAATTEESVERNKDRGEEKVEKVDPAAKVKPAAKAAIDAALKAQEKAIDAKADSTTEEKEAAKEEARAKAEAAKEAIDKADSNANVAAAKEAGVGKITPVVPKAEVKPAAKQAIEDAYTAKVAEIEARPELTTEEKAAAKAEARKLADAAKVNVDKATTDAGVAVVEQQGTTKVDNVDPLAKAKPAAKAAIDAALKAQEQAIDAKPDSTKEEKEAAKEEARAKAEAAKTAIDKATSNADVTAAKEAGVGTITPVEPKAEVKPAAKQAIEDAYTAKVAEIEKRPELTTEEKEAAKAEARKLADAAKANVDKAKTDDAVAAAEDKGTTKVADVDPAAKAKPAAKAAIDAALKAQEQAIDAKTESTIEEKEAAKEEARAKAEAAKEAIDKADSNADVTAAKEAGVGTITPVVPKAEVKPAAKQAIEDAYTAKVAEIEKRPELTTEEKEAAKAEARKLADAAKANVDKAKTDDAVAAAEDKGTTKVADVDPAAKAKPAAKAAVDAALAEKDKAIDANDKLSDAEKSAAKEEAKKAADEAKKAIDAATDQAGVDAKATEGTDAVAAVNPVGKDKAKVAVDAALAEKDKAIDANDKLSDAEKSAAKEEAKKAADEAKKAIDAATDQAGVDAKATEGTDAVAAVNPVGKDKAKAAVDAALAEKDKAIDANDKLSDAEKSAAKAQVAAEAKKAIEAIEKATTEADVEAAKEAGKAEIAKVAPETTDYKAKAKAEVEAELAKKLAELENATDLTEAEKAAAKAQVVNKAKEAIEAIQKAATEADVDQAIRNFIYRISAVIREQEEYDLSKLFVNGSVTVKQGESLTDKDVLSKLNLPSGVEIVKVEKPTTSALGTVMAKVTVKLADGSVEEINVPVEVIVSQNHGNEGNGANNGANNTEAKVNKAKLEGAIHQLDELLLKESAKLDAETAKEANVLSADAKKVFANADATQAEVDAMVKRIEDFMAKVAPLTDHANTANDQSAQTPAVVPANNQSAQTTVVAPATTQAAANASQTLSAQANARKAAKELPNTGTADSTVAMVAAAASALLGLGLAGRRRKEDEEA
ncbi:hypothetical protein CYK16_01845 [Streptococcus oralis subsp. dentisani]|uniref:Gram-positive cocci surface proteins LPxTG domain-containing protein n=1 Tax=Streptococcus oralis subsp. dentisani TaxID=1458253 RepID=A0A2I1UGI3_STROR|nr:SasC/FmtB family protein [Streptococcus oralis]PLA04936.1 hypothetical protein CYK16_01845 [Streptococcus oralis subsp. dentisani]